MTNEVKQRDKPEMIRKIFRAKIKSVDKEKFIVNAIVSDDSMDRYKESILAIAYEKRLPTYKQHPILLSSHQYDKLTCQIGLAENIYIEGNKLHASFKYFVGEGNSEADWGFKLAEKGIAAFSVGFIPHAFQDPPIPESEDAKSWPAGVRRRYTDVELLEVSQVLVPANSNALQSSLQSESDPVIKSMIEQTISSKVFEVKSSSDNKVVLKKIVIKKLEETENEFRYRVKDPELFDQDSFRQKTIKEDKPRVHAIFGKLKDGDDTMMMQSMRFPKEDGWTMEACGQWAESHMGDEKSLRIDHIKGMILHEMYPMMPVDAIWEENKAIANIAKWASSDKSGAKETIDWDKFAKGFTFQGEKKDDFAAYKMPHHDIVEGNMMTNANGVIAAMAILLGANKGEANIPDEDEEGIYDHLAKHYKETGKEAPEWQAYNDIEDAWKGCKDYKTFLSMVEKLTSTAFIKSVFAEATIALLRDKEAQIETRLSSIVLKQTDSLVKKVLGLIEAKMKNISPEKIEINLSEYMSILSAPEEQEKKNKKDNDDVIKKIQQMFPEISKMSPEEKEKGLDDHMKKILGSIQDVNSSLTVKSK